MTHTYLENTNTKLPAGKYIVGDPCYLIEDSEWVNFLNMAEQDDIFNFSVGDKNILGFYHNTAYGDGCYPFTYSKRNVVLEDNNFEGCLPVDAGLIGIISADILEAYGIDLPRSMVLIEFKNDFEPFEEEGTFVFDDIEIYTGDSEED